MSPLLVMVRKALHDLGTPFPGQTVVVGLSGGADSVALTGALTTLGASQGFRVVAAHLDHGLRAGSAADAGFCTELCARLGVPLRSARADVAARARREGAGIEAAARSERYAFLRSVVEHEGAAALAVAHTRDDQAETLLLRLLRGSGSVGLGAMRPRRGDVVRPLLGVSRAQVIEYLKQRGLPWREDPTNADPAFLRNRVRHELLPYLEARFNPRVREGLARSAALLADEAGVLAESGHELLSRIARRDGQGVVLARTALAAAPRAVARVALRQALDEAGGLRGVSLVHVERILDLAASAAPSGRRLPLPRAREAVFHFAELRVGPRPSPPTPFAYPVPVPGDVDLPGGLRLLARPAPGPGVSGAETAVVAVPEEGLVVRTRRPGDRVRAGGRELSLKRFLVDRRVPAELRQGLPLVASGHSVLWVPGQVVDGRAESGRRFVRLEVERAS